MPVLQNMAGRAVASPITLIVGNVVPLKALPTGRERLPLSAAIVGPAIAAVDNFSNRTGPNFATFRLRGTAAGTTRFELRAATGGAPLLVGVRVQAAITLPSADTEAGLIARLLLAELPGPGGADYTVEDSREAMTLMRVVVENRRATPSGRWASAGARTLADVITARGQFEGFSRYPTLSAGVTARIANMTTIANDASDGRQPTMRAHVEQVLAIAAGGRPANPTRTGLYWWRTEGSGPPGTGVTLYKSVLGNSFYREGG